MVLWIENKKFIDLLIFNIKLILQFWFHNKISIHLWVLLAICSFSTKILCLCSGGNIAICSSESCNTCIINAACNANKKLIIKLFKSIKSWKHNLHKAILKRAVMYSNGYFFIADTELFSIFCKIFYFYFYRQNFSIFIFVEKKFR